ncbi:hypothetical protein C8J57DRAFT_1221489 [Mycena rebaudengoi]|nr:hypothetical protein C8J57DRAFT_1221489 [Mycena rebaudengoi]
MDEGTPICQMSLEMWGMRGVIKEEPTLPTMQDDTDGPLHVDAQLLGPAGRCARPRMRHNCDPTVYNLIAELSKPLGISDTDAGADTDDDTDYDDLPDLMDVDSDVPPSLASMQEFERQFFARVRLTIAVDNLVESGNPLPASYDAQALLHLACVGRTLQPGFHAQDSSALHRDLEVCCAWCKPSDILWGLPSFWPETAAHCASPGPIIGPTDGDNVERLWAYGIYIIVLFQELMNVAGSPI